MALQTVGALTAEDLSTIQSSSHEFAKLMVDGDFDELVKLYTHDAVLMPPHHPAVEGQDALLAWLKTFPKVSKFSLSISDVGGYGDIAYVRGHATMTSHPEGAAEPVDEVMKYVEIRKKQVNGSWLMAVDIFNSDNA